MADYITKAEMISYINSLGLVTNGNMVGYTNQAVDIWHEMLWDIFVQIYNETNEINGENVVGTVVQRFDYLKETKRLIKNKIQQYVDMPDVTSFRDYPKWIGMIHGNPVKLSLVTSVKRVPKVNITIPDTISRNPIKTVTYEKRVGTPVTITNVISAVPTTTLTYERVDN